MLGAGSLSFYETAKLTFVTVKHLRDEQSVLVGKKIWERAAPC